MNRFINSVMNISGITLTAIILTLTFAITTHADDCFTVNGETIDANSNTRPFVCFQHDAHNEKAGLESCDRCHHSYDDQGKLIEGESSEDKSCSECHAGNVGSQKSFDSNRLNIDLAAKYHKLCRDCHIAEKKGPVVCGECHKR
ncbi:MAG: cytochrome c3 family protein [Desulfamplus sp.]|nr:cytochrome c3 family protein [Desulfamplus sp.]